MKEKNSEQHNPAKHYEGVFPAHRKNGESYFRASLTFRGKHISLGSFPTDTEAHAAYLEAKHILYDESCSLEAYSDAVCLPFEKWVCLINFRDNNIYFGNPIYLGKKMFFYYLTPHRILKFDMDDLFYFSSHKIMHRGKHYFVADYGLQVSIVSRFQIKPYAREGIDYRFLNGDNMDFRRENIEIFNSYHGVTKELKKGQYCYTVRIHVNGNYLVGRYDEEIHAAIAYNKAVDILHKNGFQKNYLQNYIDCITASQYAAIYSEIIISQKLIDLRPQSIFPCNQ